MPFIDKSTQKLAADMVETMQAEGGVGLAAPQIGKSLRIIVIQIPEEEPFAVFNPEIVKRVGEREVTEACLSIPGYEGLVSRSISVITKGFDYNGKPLRIKAEGLLAQALEHEIDHLDGILYPDRIEDKNKFFVVENRDEESLITCDGNSP